LSPECFTPIRIAHLKLRIGSRRLSESESALRLALAKTNRQGIEKLEQPAISSFVTLGLFMLNKRPTSKSKQTQKKIKLSSESIPRTNQPTLPTVWVDIAQVLIREDPSIAVIRFYTLLPDSQTEICRIATPVAHLKKLVEHTCRNLDYYPTKQSAKADESK
jgi:hypothetical protein